MLLTTMYVIVTLLFIKGGSCRGEKRGTGVSRRRIKEAQLV
jgi:hypothetical protein